METEQKPKSLQELIDALLADWYSACSDAIETEYWTDAGRAAERDRKMANLNAEQERRVAEFAAASPAVTIAIKGGAAHLVSPAGANVTILDYDVDGVDEAVLETDDEGDRFQRLEIWT